MRVYLDTCCLNRPFDDQGQERVRLEADAVLAIFELRQRGTVTWVASEVVLDEVMRNPDPSKRELVLGVLAQCDERAMLTDAIVDRAQNLLKLGFSGFDAMHIAAAEQAACDVLVTTDDRLERVARRAAAQLKVRVANVVQYALELLQQ